MKLKKNIQLKKQKNMNLVNLGQPAKTCNPSQPTKLATQVIRSG
jgi:hypothetical protein